MLYSLLLNNLLMNLGLMVFFQRTNFPRIKDRLNVINCEEKK